MFKSNTHTTQMKGIANYLRRLEASLSEEMRLLIKESLMFMLEVFAILIFFSALIFAIIIYVL